MKKIFFIALVLLPLFFLTFDACKTDENPTIINGVVVDGNTGQPVDLVEILFSSHPESDDELRQVTDHTVLTDAGGNFSIELESGRELVGSFTFKKSGYNNLIRWDFDLKKNDVNHIVINYWKQNSWLKLIMRNDIAQNDSLYITLSNKTVFPQIFPGNIQDFPVILGHGEERVQYFSFSYGTYTSIKWGNNLEEYHQNPNLDSILMPSLDTVDYLITY